LIRLEQVAKSYRHRYDALAPLSLDIAAGEVVVLLGSSGSGKSTLLKLINRLLEPDEGEVRVLGRRVQDYDPVTLRRSIGYVFQGIGLLPHLSVIDNVLTVPRLRGDDDHSARIEALGWLERVQLDPDRYAGRFPNELSGGQQQRVGVARALATGADLMLMDEPFGALDAITRDELQGMLLKLQQTLGKTLVFVTHDLFEAVRLADRVVVLHRGRIEQVGSPQDLLQAPATAFVEALFAKPLQALDDLRAP
jgi:osmoprotectant transport system ATP-binding protein